MTKKTEELQGLERLLASGLTPEEEVIARRYYSDKERKSMDADQFCGPHRSFPITSQEDVNNAAHLIGKADSPDAVKACIKGKAKANGWSIPDAWQDEDKQAEERYMAATLTRAAADHEPMSTTHTHSHPAFGSQGDDETHSHEHSHENDNDHKHPGQHESTDERAESGTIQASDRHVMSLPLVRIDAAKREVWGQATAEVPDSYGTIFGFYPDAWTKWRGNIREQHDPKKAVGKAVDIRPEEQERAIYVGSRVSRGAQDTWLKVEDNVLTGYSASIIPDPEYGHDISKWPKKEYNGKQYPYLPRYTVAELSLVDNPACPGCNIQIVRADGFATDVLDCTEEETPPAESVVASSSESLERAGARLSADSRAALHEMRDKAMTLCGCDECSGMQSASAPDGDEDMERTITGLIERILEKQLTPVYARLQGIAGTLSRSNAAPTEATLNTLISGAIERAVQSAATVNESSLAEVRASQGAVKEQVDAIAKQVDAIANTPVPGAPVMNTGAMPRPVDKRLATDPYQAPQRSGSAVYDAIARMSEAGMLDTPDRQADAMAAGLVAQRGRR